MLDFNQQKTEEQLINLDFLSAAPLLPEVIDAMLPYLAKYYGNPSSLHRYGLYARDAIDTARHNIARFINAQNPEQIYFTSDATEASNWAVKGSAEALKRFGNHIITSAIEHPPVYESLQWLENQGYKITRIPVDPTGKVNPELIKSGITNQTILIAIQIANADIGVIQDIDKIDAIAAEAGIQLYIDTDAAAGWLPIDVKKFNSNALVSFSAQRFYGPKGCGILYRSQKARLANFMHGGSQQLGKRPGIENVPIIVGAGKAAEIASTRLNQRIQKAFEIQKLLWNQLKKRVPHIKLNGPPPGLERLPNSLNISFEFIEGEGLVLLCDMKGLLISSGTACSSRATKIPISLPAIGLDYSLAVSSALLSWGEEINKEDISRAVDILTAAVEKLRSMSAGWQAYKSGKISPLTPQFAE